MRRALVLPFALIVGACSIPDGVFQPDAFEAAARPSFFRHLRIASGRLGIVPTSRSVPSCSTTAIAMLSAWTSIPTYRMIFFIDRLLSYGSSGLRLVFRLAAYVGISATVTGAPAARTTSSLWLPEKLCASS